MAKRTNLPNGIKIVSDFMPHVRSVAMGVWVDVGARDESEEESGLSHFIEHMIFKGTTRRTAYQIAKEFDAIGGQSNAFTSLENTCYHARVMDTHLDTMVDILSDIFLNSVFEAEELERERAVILQEIGMVEDTPEEYIHILSSSNFWGDHPLGRSILGTREHIGSFSAENVKEFFTRLYHPERIVISVAGRVDHEHFVDMVAPLFGTIQASRDLPARTTPRITPKHQIQTRSLEQVHVCLTTPGLSVTDPLRFACSLMNTILGGNMSSRLFQEIREKRGLAYSVYSFMMSHVDTGMFGVYTGVAEQNVDRAIELILKEMRHLRQAHVSADELQDAKEFTKGNLLLASESVENQMVRLAQNEIHFGTYIPFDKVLEQINAVTVEEIRSLAESLFQEERLCLTLLGPIAKRAIAGFDF